MTGRGHLMPTPKGITPKAKRENVWDMRNA